MRRSGRDRIDVRHPVGPLTGGDERFRALFEAARDGIFTLALDGTITALNPAFTDLSGWQQAHWIGGSFRSLLVADDVHAALEMIDQVTAGRSPRRRKLRLRHADGGNRTGEFIMGPEIHGSEVVGIVGIVRDVTASRDVSDRQHAEEALRVTERKYRSLVEQIPAITYIDMADEEGTTVYLSPQVESILGYTPEEWIRSPTFWVDHLHPEDRERAAAGESGSSAMEPFRLEYRMIARDGRTVWLREEAVPILDEAGRPAFVQGVMFDITLLKQAEEDLRKALESEREVAARLRALDEMKSTFLNAVSHELRTPLTSVLGFALTLERGHRDLLPADIDDLVARLAANARKLDRLLADLLDLDRLNRGILEPDREPVDVTELARRMVAASEVLGGRQVDVIGDPLVVAVDRPKVERIVENLLANTARHTPAGTRVWVRIEPSEGGVLIAVDDAGPGIPPGLHAAVFAPFRQVESRPHSPGVGIGLSLVARFAELHGGRAWVEDREGGGASFRVFLPAVPA